MKKIVALSVLFLLALVKIVSAQHDTTEGSLLRDVPGWMAENHVPCVGVGLIENGKIKFLKVFGKLQQGRPAPTNTLFNIASQTKPATAMLTLQLVQAGLWNLDEPLAHYWIDPDIAADPYLNKLTTRIVLSHQTGFPNWRTDNGETKLRFRFEPGTRFGYSGEGYEYLRHALENRFHQPLNVLLDIYLFGPLGMKDSHYWSEELDTNRFAMWHDGQGNRYPTSIQTPVNAADDLITTVEDYCKLGINTMNGMGLSDSLFGDMVKAQVKVKENYYRGLGWGLVKGLPDGEYALEHGGSDIGVRTMAIFIPKTKTGIVLMTNGDNGMFVTDRIIKRTLPYGAQILETMNKGAAAHQRIVIPDETIKSYTGIYEQSNGKLMKVEQQGNAIKVSGDGVPTAVLFPESKNKFFLDGYDVQLEFSDLHSLIVYENGKQVMRINRQSAWSQTEHYKVYALRFGSMAHPSPVSGLVANGPQTDSINMDFMIWLIKGDNGRNILLDAGFLKDIPEAKDFDLANYVRPDSVLPKLGLKAGDITDVILSHPHWDHIDGLGLFPNAQVWMQKEDFNYYVGGAWQKGGQNGGFNKRDIRMLIELNLAGKLTLVDGDDKEIIPGIKVYTGARHTFNSQYVLVETGLNKIILASDNIWIYYSLEHLRPASAGGTWDTAAQVRAMVRMKTMVTSPRYIVPGHDSKVFSIFPRVAEGVVKIE